MSASNYMSRDISEQMGGIFAAFFIIMIITWIVSKIMKLLFHKYTDSIVIAKFVGFVLFIAYYIQVYQGKSELISNAISFAFGTFAYIGFLKWRRRKNDVV